MCGEETLQVTIATAQSCQTPVRPTTVCQPLADSDHEPRVVSTIPSNITGGREGREDGLAEGLGGCRCDMSKGNLARRGDLFVYKLKTDFGKCA